MVQRVLGDLVSVVGSATGGKVPYFIEQARTARLLLLNEDPKIDAAIQIIANLGLAAGYRRRGGLREPTVLVFLDLGSFIYLYIATMFFLSALPIVIPQTLVFRL